MKTTIGIIDDHQIVRQGLKELLENLGGFSVVSEYENGEEFLSGLPLADPPDILILDYSMPKISGIDVLKELNSREEEYKVLLLTQHLEEQIIDDAYHYGARGFLHKNCTAHDLKFALENIVNFGYNNISEILKRVKSYRENEIQGTDKKPSLTDREIHFLELVCDENEFTYDQMAEIMGVSLKSVEFYRASLFDKFNIKSKVGLVLFSYKHKLTRPFV